MTTVAREEPWTGPVMTMAIVAAYYLSNETREARLADLLQTCGSRMRLSVFMLSIYEGELDELRDRPRTPSTSGDSAQTAGTTPVASLFGGRTATTISLRNGRTANPHENGVVGRAVVRAILVWTA